MIGKIVFRIGLVFLFIMSVGIVGDVLKYPRLEDKALFFLVIGLIGLIIPIAKYLKVRSMRKS